jgi:hypothetical protein
VFKNTLESCREHPTCNLSPEYSKNEQVFYSPPPNFGFEELSKNIRKKKPLLKNALFNTLKFKNVLSSSREQWMCH